jgi:type II secretory pathway component PulF
MSPRRLAVWYSQLASLTRAGVTIPSAVRDSLGLPLAAREKLADWLEVGGDPREVWPSLGREVDEADALMLAAGQLSGRFPDVCEELAERHRTRARLRTKLFLGALYPLFLIHAVAVLAPFIRNVDFSGKESSGTLSSILISGAFGACRNLVILWAFAGLVWFLLARFPNMRVTLLRVIPLWSGASRHAALATFAGTLASLLRAGVGIGQAWGFAGKVSADPRLVAASAKIAVAVDERAEPPGKLLRDMGEFPEDFRALYLTGERTGKLEERLDELRAKHEAVAVARATTAAFVYPVLLTVLAMLLVAARVVSFWAKYFEELMKMAQ